MKRILLLILIVLMCFLASCSMGGGYTDITDNPDTEQPSTPTEPEMPADPDIPEDPQPDPDTPSTPVTPEEPDTPAEEHPSVTVSAPSIMFRGFQKPSRNAVITISIPDGATVYYTTDGSQPTTENGSNYNRREYTVTYGNNHISSGVVVSAGCEVKAVAYKDGGYSRVVSMMIPTTAQAFLGKISMVSTSPRLPEK